VVHGGESCPPETVAETLLGRSFPVVLSRFGGHPLNRDLMDEAIDLLDRYDGYYLDTSFVRYREQLERALLEHPDRVLFGSGAPSAHPNVGVMEILTLDVSEDKMRRAFSKNASRVVDAVAPESDG
jgi:predicted TIM-barrel fold metal-dependent hydrolase